MLEKIKVALQNYKDIYEGATKVWKQARTDLHENYKGNLFTSKLNEAKDLYEKTLQDARTDNFATCLVTIDDVRRKVQEIVSTPVSAEFPATLEAIKNIKNPSKTELEAIINPFKNNYVAYRSFCDVLGSHALVTYDEIMGYCEELEGMLHRCFYTNSIADYDYRNMLEGTILDGYDSLFTAFVSGAFDVASDTSKIMKDGEK